jgi:hypothetical protein
MDGMTLIERDWRQESLQKCTGDTVRYTMASLGVFGLILAVTLTIIVVLDQAGIHLPLGGWEF